MVGVPKSTGCIICRRRKIKCDETWPNCVNCRKNSKCCPGPPAKHTFKDSRPRLHSNTPLITLDESPGPFNVPSKRLTQLNEKWSDSGAVTHKFRISRKKLQLHPEKKDSRRPKTGSASASFAESCASLIFKHPSPSKPQNLAQALAIAIDSGGVGHRMSSLGPFIREVPRRVGHNAALDAAVACLVDAHSSLLYKRHVNEIANPSLYLRAVQTLQSCLEHPRHGMSTNTLCASVLLGLVEALAGPRVGNRYLAHVGGAGRLLQLQGPGQCRDSFAKELLHFNRGGIVVTSIYERKPCFLISPEWREIAFDTTGLNFNDCIYTEIGHRMASFPTLLDDLKDVHRLGLIPLNDSQAAYDSAVFPSDDQKASITRSSRPVSTTSPESEEFSTVACPYEPSRLYEEKLNTLLSNLYGLKTDLATLGVHLTATLMDGSAAIELASMDADSPVHTTYHFTNWRVMVVYNCYWSLILLANKVILKLLEPQDPALDILEADCQTVALEICKTWEDAWASRPIGAFHTGLSFVLAYEFCSPEVQAWILRGLNALLDHQHVETFRWSHDVIHSMSGKLAGEGPDLVFSCVK